MESTYFVYLPRETMKFLSTKIKGIDENSSRVSQEQLDSVTELNLNDVGVMYLSYFRNLKTLVIDSAPSIVDKDRVFLILSRNCPNISTLVIKNQNDIKYIDVSRLDNLKNLSIISNEGLIEVNGLTKELLNRLDTFEFYDNLNFTNSSELNNMLKETNNIKSVKLDALYYLDYVNVDKKKIVDYKWHEKIGYINQRNISYSNGEMDVAYNYAKSIIDTLIKPNDSDNMKISVIYSWIINNIKIVDERKPELNEGIVNVFKYRESSVQTIAKFYQFLLKVAGIESYDINVMPRLKFSNSKLGTFKIPSDDYEIVKIPTDEGVRYFDIAWDYKISKEIGRQSSLFMFNGLSDIACNHKLIFDNISENSESMPEDERRDYVRKSNKRLQNAKYLVVNDVTEKNNDVYQSIIKSHNAIVEQMKMYNSSVENLLNKRTKKVRHIDEMISAVESANKILKNNVYRLEEILEDRLLNDDLGELENRLGMKISPFKQVVTKDGFVVKSIKNKEELNAELKRIHGTLNKDIVDGNISLSDYRYISGEADRVYTYLITFAYEKSIVDEYLNNSNSKAM